MNQFIKYIKRGSNMIEAVKLTVLVGGIVFGVIRDLHSPESNSFYYNIHQSYQKTSHIITSFNSLAKDMSAIVLFSEFTKQ
jgi:hypothetical protein